MIGILTFYWADDYGAMLQSYALKTYLNKYEHTILIPYFPIALRNRYRLFLYNEEDSILRRLYKIIRQMKSKAFYYRLYKKRNMNRFRRKYLVKSIKGLKCSKDISDYKKNMRVYVVGSDQVWNPEITEGFQEGYFCTFRKWQKENIHYVTYAASIGKACLEEKYNEEFSGLLNNFDIISIREPLSELYIEKMSKRKVSVVLDPVFLIEKNEWEGLLKKESINVLPEGFLRIKKTDRTRGYIAVYDTEYLPEMAEYLKYLQERTGLEVVVINPIKKNYCWTENAEYIIGKGPLEFLAVLYQASYVVTNSFHGTAFSIIFHKKFVTFLHSTRGARTLDLLRTAHLESRLAYSRKIIDIDDQIDWNLVGKVLSAAIVRSKAFIQKEIISYVSPASQKRAGE